ncbi:MAG: ABC transporter substrate-binding protein [Gammaproteobacteria bacterium]|nr:ABC transporter substrate-binding protein [Gammaproteobacteria bacterium]
MFKLKKVFIAPVISVIGAYFLVLSSYAANTSCLSEPAVAEVKSAVDEILVVLKQKKAAISKDRKVAYKIIDKYLVPKADFKIMAQLVLTSNWKKLNDQQKQNFVKEFSRLMIRTYGVAFEAYDDQTVEFHCPVRTLPKIGDVQRVEISSTIHQNRQPDNIVKFRLVNNANEWKAYDLSVDNVSIVDSYRTVFASKFRKQKDPDAIIKEMHDKNCTGKMTCND